MSNEPSKQFLHEKVKQRTKDVPAPAGGDIDVDKYQSKVVGEEAVGGTTPTPDQDNVDYIASSVGVERNDFEEVQSIEKMAERDKNRWQLDPASENRD